MASQEVASLYCVVGLTYTFAVILLSTRFLARKMKVVKYSWDDYFAVIAWLFATDWNIVMLQWVSLGLGRHAASIDLPADQVTKYSLLYNWCLDLFYALSLGCSKLSLLWLYWRLFCFTSIRNPIRTVGIFVVIWITVRTSLTIFSCVPVRGFWDKSIPSICAIDKRLFFFGSTFAHLVLDVFILALPVRPITKLELQLLPKIGLMLTFAFGLFVCMASVLVLIPAFQYDDQNEDITFSSVSMFTWATVEVNLAVAAGSFLMIRIIIEYLYRSIKGHSHTFRPGIVKASQYKRNTKARGQNSVVISGIVDGVSTDDLIVERGQECGCDGGAHNDD